MKREISPCIIVAFAFLVMALALPATSLAHTTPTGCFLTGGAISFGAFRADGTTPVGANSATECETLFFQAFLTKAAGDQSCAIEQGAWTITLPDGTVVNTTPATEIPCLTGGSLNVTDDPNLPGGRGLCESAGEIVLASELVEYQVSPADLVPCPNDPTLGCVVASSAWEGFSHLGPADIPGTGAFTPFPVTIDICDDGEFCNGQETCDPTLVFGAFDERLGNCVDGEPPDCDDEDNCTIDSCDEINDVCVNDPVVCDDNDLCTTDACDPDTGQCVFTPVNCDDSDACTADSCDPATGSCVNAPISCDDNNACTTDSCDPATGCVNAPIDCDDGNACTADSCDPATGCVNEAIDCDDGNACTADSCDPATGCVNEAIDCDDGNACTADSCDPATGCVNEAIDCDDGNACTADSCDPATGCVNEAINCDDSDACTTDSCDPATGCVNEAIDCDDGNACTADSCDPATGCVNEAIDCDDGNACTADSCDPATGCVNEAIDCDDGNACTADSCDPATGCVNEAINCDDSNACTADSCDPATGCVNAPINCDDSDACTTDSCDPATGCVNEAIDCDDGNACTADSCDPATGCVNEAIDCDDTNACTDDSCDPAVGCVNECAPEGKPECEITIGDFIWDDMNQDGIQDMDEPGIEGVKVNLVDDCFNAATTIDMTFTDENGFYGFTVNAVDDACMPISRDLLIEVDSSNFEMGGVLDGYNGSPKDQGMDDALDSDCDSATGQTDCTTYTTGDNSPNADVDCGFFAGEFITRTLGYWKNHPNVIDGSFDGPGGFPSLLPQEFCGEPIVEACDAVAFLSTGGGGINCFKRQGMAALLNCQAFGCPGDTLDLIEAASDACGTGADFDFGDACDALDYYNESGDDLDLPFQSPKADPKACK